MNKGSNAAPCMRLAKFRVTSFRSVDDSGWIEVDDVTALIGTNESGKSNLLLPLWKLNPAKEGEIHPTSDFPRKRFNDLRGQDPKPVFIEALFIVEEPLRGQLARETGLPEQDLAQVTVKRRLDGAHEIEFPLVPSERTAKRDEVAQLLDSAASEIAAITPMKTEQDLAKAIGGALQSAQDVVPKDLDTLELEVIEGIRAALAGPDLEGGPKTSSIIPRFAQLKEELDALNADLSKPHPKDADVVRTLILDGLPKFVYYSNYGNLDSEIYLPHVIENLKRENLGQKEQAKARTLKVLFEFVKLQPQEILDLGKDLHEPGKQPTAEQVDQAAEKKKERSILLQSASTSLTEKFKVWWKQGDYRFRFEADGDHFRIWVSDDRRPEEIELEGRSTGLQWFLSFYLVFLVESQDTHTGCVLLLDEPGHSLHPLAQRDLSDFFDGLAQHNQLVYTTHSPFLVDADRLDRARKVFVAPDGTSKATPDLGADEGDISKRGAGYAVHAALGLSVAEGLLIGCSPVVVEGPSDQHYMTAIKTLLIARGLLKPGRELVFPPAGGAKGIKAVASILGGRDEQLPIALLDSDPQGNNSATGLRSGLYKADPERVLQVGDFVTLSNAEVEDLIPSDVVVRVVDRFIREPEVPFADTHASGTAIVPQIESWASTGGATLSKGWKVELAKRVKRTLLDGAEVANDDLITWQSLFSSFDPPAPD